MLIEKKVYKNVNEEIIGRVRNQLEKWCEPRYYNTFEVIVVLYELYNNALKYSDKATDIILKLYKNSIVIRIKDRGKGFDAMEALKIKPCKLERNLYKPCGRGIYIVKKFVSKIYYNAKGNDVVVKMKASR